MINDNTIESNISTLIPAQIPDYFRENGPILVEFVKEYFKFLETTGQSVYYARRHIENKDVDKTINDFLIHFKKKFTPNITYNIFSDIPLTIKESLPFYRSKGSDLSFDLFFKLIFGVPAEIYHPGDDLLSCSSGEWHKDIYLELTPAESNNQFIGKEIIGVNSGAIAFVDRLIRRIINGRIIDVMYISSISGNFEFGEMVTLNA